MNANLDPAKIANNLKLLRVSRGITQSELCNKLFITRTTYCCYENGTKLPDLKSIDSLAKYYNVSFNAIVTKDLSTKSMQAIYFGFNSEPLQDVLTKYESLSSGAKRLVMERLNTLLEREKIFYKEYDNFT